MHEKVVENWLINANELSYTVAFCQILNQQGFKIIRVSEKKTSLEQGKDIIATDKLGKVHCYQLKAGRVNTKVWEKEILPQLNSLTDIMPVHPAMPKFKDWTCHLVVNGVINDEASQAIKNYQDTRKFEKKRPLYLITTQDLLSDFKKHFGKYLPDNLVMFEKFLELYNSNSDEIIDINTYSRYFESHFQTVFDDKHISHNALIQLINSSLVINSMLLGKKYAAGNHAAAIQGWLITLMNILAVGTKSKVKWSEIKPSFELIMSELVVLKNLLKTELLASDLIVREGGTIYSESLLYRHRFTYLTGLISAIEMCEKLFDSSTEPDDVFSDWVVKNLKYLRMECEADTVSIINTVFLLSNNKKVSQAAQLLATVTKDIIETAYNHEGLPDPYHSYDEVMKSNLSVRLSDKIDENFSRQSYTLPVLMTIWIRLGIRDVIEQNWRLITYIHLMKFVPKYDYGYFMRRAEGTVYSELEEHTKSYKLLQQAANSDTSGLPEYLKDNNGLVYLLTAIYPHRSGSEIAKLMSLE